MTRPDRSDAHPPPEEEARSEAETREYFEGIAPKRHTKPSRSEYSSVYSDAFYPSGPESIPELHKLRDLKSHPQAEELVSTGSQAVEEYVETEYYKDLNSVEKRHHTTGTGFIEMEPSDGSSCIGLTPVSDASCHVSCKGNPATNEWIPSSDTVIQVSHKPKRSET